MFDQSIGFVGGGRITRILLEGWRRAGVQLKSVVISDPDSAALDRLPKASNAATTVVNDNSAAAEHDIVFLAVHPPAMPVVAGEIAATLRPEAVIVSLAPKFTIAKLTELLGGFRRIARMIPNAPSLVGQGFNPVAFGAALPTGKRAMLGQLFNSLGAMPEVPEKLLEAYAVISAMGPTYLWPQLAELCNQAIAFGMSSSEAVTAVRWMTAGAAATLADSGLVADEVMNLVPVRPLREAEDAFREAYRTKLPAIMAMIRPS